MLVLAAAPALAGCGSAHANADGGDGAPITPDGTVEPIAGMHAYDVTALLSATSNGPLPPPTDHFTLVVDADARRVIAGGKGRGASVPLTTTDGRTFRSAGGFSVGREGEICSGVQDLQYDTFELTVTDGALTGTARGRASISCGDCVALAPFAATLNGTPDTTAPALLTSGAVPTTAFDPFVLVASEPLPASATAQLIDDDGAAIELVPTIVGDAERPLVVGFAKPPVVLRAGQGYVVTFDGLVDFAGNADLSGAPLRITSLPDAPLVPEDGFESAVDAAEVGGAQVVTGDPLPPIAGKVSVYAGSTLDAPRGVAGGDHPLGVRLARQPGDATLRLTYRVVGVTMAPAFSGSLRIGAEGGALAPPVYTFPAPSPAEKLLVGAQPVFVSGATTMMVPLPADVTDEALLVIAATPLSCGLSVSPQAGLLIDDLTLE